MPDEQQTRPWRWRSGTLYLTLNRDMKEGEEIAIECLRSERKFVVRYPWGAFRFLWRWREEPIAKRLPPKRRKR